jgi:hypothetical protein
MSAEGAIEFSSGAHKVGVLELSVKEDTWRNIWQS